MKHLEINNFKPLDYACSEAVNTLCTNLVFSNARSIMFSSCEPNEGKSFLTINAARCFAGMWKSVVLVDADLRKSMFAMRYGLGSDQNMPGLAHYLAEQCSIDDIIYETNVDGMYVVLQGVSVVNSMQLLSGELFPALIRQLTENFDYVIVDTPPIGMIIDPAVIASACDGSVLVISSGNIHRHDAIEAKQQLESSGCPLLGVVLNKVSMTTGHYSKRYGYKYSKYSQYDTLGSSQAARQDTRL